MSPIVAELLEKVLALPDDEREEFAAQLWDALPEPSPEEAADEVWRDPVFRAEIERRLDVVAEQGTAHLPTLEEAMVQVRSNYSANQSRDRLAAPVTGGMKMSPAANELLEKVLALPTDEREEFVEQLRDALPESLDDELEELWNDPEFCAEFDRRLADVAENGTADCVPWEESMARIQAMRAAKRAP